MKTLVLTVTTLLALYAPAAPAEAKSLETLPVINRELVNSQTGAPVAGCPKILQLMNNL